MPGPIEEGMSAAVVDPITPIEPVGPEPPRFESDPVDTSIDTTDLAGGDPVAAEVETLDAPEDITATEIEDYDPYEAVLGEVAPGSTVSSQLDGLLSQSNPYIDRARTSAAQASNRRGMLNSSMAAGAAEGAAIDAALPIAQQDARANLEQQFLNQGYSNEEAKHLADASITRNNLQAGINQDTSVFNATNTIETDRINAEAENAANIAEAAEINKQKFQKLTADLTAQLKGIDNEMAMRLETLTQEYGLLENMDSINGAIHQELINGISEILANEDNVELATQKINDLIAAAGAEFEYSDGMSGGTTPLPEPPPVFDPVVTPSEGSDGGGGGTISQGSGGNDSSGDGWGGFGPDQQEADNPEGQGGGDGGGGGGGGGSTGSGESGDPGNSGPGNSESGGPGGVLMIIRDAIFEDAEALLPLAKEAHAASFMAAWPMNEAELQRLFVVTMAFDDGFAKVVERDGKVVGGMIGAVTNNAFGIRCGADNFTFSRGGTNELIKEFKTWALSRGAKFVHLTDLSGRPRYHRLITGLGFEPCGFNFVGVA